MKNIQAISIWDKGQSKQATILNAYAINVSLNNSATFWYGLISETNELLAQGNLIMSGEAYEQWEIDSFAWDWVASSLNLVITGEYVNTVPATSIVEETTTTTTTVVVE